MRARADEGCVCQNGSREGFAVGLDVRDGGERQAPVRFSEREVLMAQIVSPFISFGAPIALGVHIALGMR